MTFLSKKAQRPQWVSYGRWGFLTYLLVYTNPKLNASIKASVKTKINRLLSYLIINNAVSVEKIKGSEEIVVGTAFYRIDRLLSYIELNNAVSLVIVVLTLFSKGEGEFLTALTPSDFLPLNGKWRPDKLFNAINGINAISLTLGDKAEKKLEKKFTVYPKGRIFAVNDLLALALPKIGVPISFPALPF